MGSLLFLTTSVLLSTHKETRWYKNKIKITPVKLSLSAIRRQNLHLGLDVGTFKCKNSLSSKPELFLHRQPNHIIIILRTFVTYLCDLSSGRNFAKFGVICRGGLLTSQELPDSRRQVFGVNIRRAVWSSEDAHDNTNNKSDDNTDSSIVEEGYPEQREDFVRRRRLV